MFSFEMIKKINIILNKKEKRYMSFLVLLMLVGAILETLGVSMIVPLISIIFDKDMWNTNEVLKRFTTLFNIGSQRDFIIMMLCALIVFYITKNILLFFEYYLQAKFVCDSRLKTKTMLLKCYLDKPYEYYFTAKSGEILREISTDATNSYNIISQFLAICTELIVSVALIVTILIIDSTLAIIFAVVLLIEMAIIYKFIKPILRKAGKKWTDATAISHKWILQSIDGIKEIKVAQKEHYFVHEYKDSASEASNSEMISATFSNVPRLLIEAGTVSAVLLVIIIMLISGQNVEKLIPSFSAFAVAAVRLLPSVNRISGSLNTITYNMPALDNLIKTLNEVSNKEDKAETGETDLNDGAMCFSTKIELKNLIYKYPTASENVLDNINLEINAGNMVGIIGASGSGKTTTVDLILGLLDWNGGDICIDGKSLKENKYQWLKNVGYIPQNIFLLGDTIRANVAFGDSPEQIDEMKVWDALKQADIDEFVRSLPEGLDSEVGEKGIRLSGGQKQRIGIARALYKNPSVLFFDEATSALDMDTEEAIMQAINAFHGKKTIVIIAHRLSTIEKCDVVYKVENRKISLVKNK